jgi:hypothetical protein
MNSVPTEFQFTVDGTTSPVLSAGRSKMRLFQSPTSLLTLPADPLSCSGNPLACLPSGAIECTTPSATCVPRLVVIDYPLQAGNRLFGLFDLDTGLFAAYAQTGGKTRVLVSTGSELDPVLVDVIAQLAAAGSELTGADLMALLNTNVRISLVDGNGIRDIEVGVLYALQITKMFNATGRPNAP